MTLLCLLGVGFLCLIASVQPDSVKHVAISGHNDFLQLYIGAKLEGSPSLYSPEANKRVQAEAIGMEGESLLYARPPFYTLLLKPLAALPYQTAYIVFQCFSLTSILVFVWVFARRDPEIALLASISVPLVSLLMLGQDVSFVALAYAAFYLLSERGRNFAAGLALSFCLIKFHFLPLTVLALLMRKEWVVMRGFVLGCLVAIVLSFVAGGAGWPAAYWAVLTNPVLHPGSRIMPNLHGLITVLGGSQLEEMLLMGIVIAAFMVIVVRGSERPLTYSLALVGGLLISVHAYIQDAFLLLLALGILGDLPAATAIRKLLTISVTPVPYAFLLRGSRWSAVMPCLLIATLASGVIASLRRQGTDAVRAAADVPG